MTVGPIEPQCFSTSKASLINLVKYFLILRTTDTRRVQNNWEKTRMLVLFDGWISLDDWLSETAGPHMWSHVITCDHNLERDCFLFVNNTVNMFFDIGAVGATTGFSSVYLPACKSICALTYFTRAVTRSFEPVRACGLNSGFGRTESRGWDTFMTLIFLDVPASVLEGYFIFWVVSRIFMISHRAPVIR